MKFRHYLLFSFILFMMNSCNDDKPKSIKSKNDCTLILNKNKIKNGDTVHFDVLSKSNTIVSKEYAIDGVKFEYQEEFQINNLSLGKHKLSAKANFENGGFCDKYVFLEILSDLKPVDMTYDVINTFPHDNMSYTQGLEYVDGIMFEGTGQYGFSYIENYNLMDMESINKIELGDNVFGEGITVKDNKIYQITYREKKAFVYDQKTFEKINEFSYQGMGWGLTHDDNHLIMSNGSNELAFRNPETFAIEKRIYVYDNVSKIDSLNELEYVNGAIYANIYQRDDIVKIDPETGAVLARINCTGILDPKDVKSKVDVLNGIAYNETRNSFYITGKFWPKMYEVNFVTKD